MRFLAAVIVFGTLAAPATAQGPTVTIIDNAFLRGVQRPTVVVTPGTTVTWRWSSRQSHGIAVRSGPEHFSTPIRSGGAFRRRLTRVGTYRLVCPLHAPGMKMRVVVRRG